tara:strand:- start:4595 stop:4798 length:204 start_codon:yes stop_codon:yes gene_type:complete
MKIQVIVKHNVRLVVDKETGASTWAIAAHVFGTPITYEQALSQRASALEVYEGEDGFLNVEILVFDV